MDGFLDTQGSGASQEKISKKVICYKNSSDKRFLVKRKFLF